jgi:homoserine dehydrogenase
VHIALLGCGTVGSGVAELLLKNAEAIAEIGGVSFSLDAIAVRCLDRPRSSSLPAELFRDDAEALIADPSIDLIIECIGGLSRARDYVETALASGKHVVTANKDLLALHGPQLRALAARHGVTIQYEAAVGGAIPIIRTITGSLAGEEILEVGGVLNGTTNFILSEMANGADYGAALAEAQARGFAEADPTNDVAGIDAAHKLAILMQLAFRRAVTSELIPRCGIEHLTRGDFQLARRMELVVKLVACARATRTGGDLELAAAVSPAYVHRDHPFAAPLGPHNCIRVVGRASGSLTFAGRGAGREPTASAVVGDVVATLRMIAERHPAVSRLEPAGKLSERAFSLPRIVRVTSFRDARPACDAIAAAGIGATLIDNAPALRTQPLPLLHDAPLTAALHEAGINPESIIPIWEDMDDVSTPSSATTATRQLQSSPV